MAKKQEHLVSGAVLRYPKIFFLIVPLLLLLSVGVLFYSARQNMIELAAGCRPVSFSGNFELGKSIAYLDNDRYQVPAEGLPLTGFVSPRVLGIASGERWIEVDLSDQKLTAWDGDKVFLQTPVSTGLRWWPTPTGEFRIWIKLRYTRMEGGSGRYYYNLPNVPYTMFFEGNSIPGWRGYGLHGTYWHNDFGTPRSHGCVNLPTPVAERLFYWTSPPVPEGKSVVKATATNPGTRIVIHN